MPMFYLFFVFHVHEFKLLFKLCKIVFASRIPPRLLRTRGLVVKICAAPERKFSFVLILCHCLICARPWNDFGVPVGAGRLRKGSPETSQRQPQTFQTASLECLWGAFGRPGLPRGAGGLKETTQATQNRPPVAKARRFEKHTPK